MPVEVERLRHMPVYFERCPCCEVAPFRPFMRGEVHRSAWTHPLSWAWATLRGQPWPYCAVICQQCKAIVAWEWAAAGLDEI